MQTFFINDVAIQLYVPKVGCVKAAYTAGEIEFPYWSKVWPAAVAIATFIAEQKTLIQNKTILELGAGLGLPSLMAASYARSVLCTDYSVEAVSLAAASAKHAGLKNFNAAVIDWNNLPDHLSAGVLLLSDVNYEPVQFAALMMLIQKFLAAGAIIIISTPQRLMAKPFAESLHHYITQQKDFFIADTAVTVMVLQQKGSTG